MAENTNDYKYVDLAGLSAYTAKLKLYIDKGDETATSGAKLTSAVTVAGGPLADDTTDNWPEDWYADDTKTIRQIPANTSFQDLITSLFLKQLWGILTGPTYSWNPTLGKPTVSVTVAGANASGKSYPVGTEVTLSATQNNTVSSKGATATVSGATYGYSLDGTTIASTATTYTTPPSTTNTPTGTNSMTTQWSGIVGEDDNAGKFFLASGTNTLKADESGLSIAPGEFTETTVYSVTNINTVKDSVSKTINQTGFEASTAYKASKSLTSTNSVSVTGYYPIYYGGNSMVSAGDTDITAAVVKAFGDSKSTVPSSISITAGTGTLILAVPYNSYKSKTTITTVTGGNYSFGTSHYVDIDIPMLNDVETVKYRVFYVSNAGVTGNADTIKVSLS